MIKESIVNFSINESNWKVVRCDIDFTSSEISKAFQQAKLKSQFTMNASQSGAFRSPEMKYNMQLMGIIAEIGCKKYLEKILEDNNLSDEWSVIRYDDVRTDGFRSAENEFDIKIISKTDSNKFLLVESRSSITYNRSFVQGLKGFDIIGPYSSVAKAKEGSNDIYLRPLYEYTEYNTKRYSKLDFEKLLQNKKVILYIVAGCTFEEMQEKGINKSMMQGGTRYLVLPIVKAKDGIDFKNEVVELVKALG